MSEKPTFNLPADSKVITGWAFLGQLLIVYHNADGEVPASRLEEFFSDMREREFTHLLSFGVGGAKINSLHRKTISELLKGKRISTIADNPITRGLVTAMSWLGVDIKSFAQDDMDKAISFLNVEGLSDGEIRACANELAEKCDDIRNNAPG